MAQRGWNLSVLIRQPFVSRGTAGSTNHWAFQLVTIPYKLVAFLSVVGKRSRLLGFLLYGTSVFL